MLDRVLRNPRVIAHHRASSLGPWLDELVDGLLRRGYTRAVVDGYVRGVVHFGRWLELQGVGPSRIGEATVQRFLAHAPDCRCGVDRGTPSDRRYGVPHMQEVLLRHGVIAAPRSARRPTPADRLIERFAIHLRDNRGMMKEWLHRVLEDRARLSFVPVSSGGDRPAANPTSRPPSVRRRKGQEVEASHRPARKLGAQAIPRLPTDARHSDGGSRRRDPARAQVVPRDHPEVPHP